MAEVINTLQSGIKKYSKNDITNYSLFLGGLNATQQALAQYDPLKTGYARIFFIKMPVFMEKLLPRETKNFRHLLEYGFTSIQGIGNTELNMDQITGGYAGRSFDVATTATDGTQNVTISLYEFAGSPVREYLDMWITGISDPYTGLGHYHGAMDLANANLKYSQANHVAEAIYVVTDPTGRSDGIEYAALLSNMMPKSVPQDHFNYESGQHPITTIQCEFSCVKYQSPQINTIAKALIDKFQVMRDYLDFESQYTTSHVDNITKNWIYNWPKDKGHNQGLTPPADA